RSMKICRRPSRARSVTTRKDASAMAGFPGPRRAAASISTTPTVTPTRSSVSTTARRARNGTPGRPANRAIERNGRRASVVQGLLLHGGGRAGITAVGTVLLVIRAAAPVGVVVVRGRSTPADLLRGAAFQVVLGFLPRPEHPHLAAARPGRLAALGIKRHIQPAGGFAGQREGRQLRRW